MMTDMVGNSGMPGLNRAQQIEVIARRHFRFLTRTDHQKVNAYLKYAEELLRSKEFVYGCEFKDYCSKKGVYFEERNSWASCVTALRHMGWIVSVGMVEPNMTHNHMPVVNRWRSLLFVGSHGETDLEQLLA